MTPSRIPACVVAMLAVVASCTDTATMPAAPAAPSGVVPVLPAFSSGIAIGPPSDWQAYGGVTAWDALYRDTANRMRLWQPRFGATSVRTYTNVSFVRGVLPSGIATGSFGTFAVRARPDSTTDLLGMLPGTEECEGVGILSTKDVIGYCYDEGTDVSYPMVWPRTGGFAQPGFPIFQSWTHVLPNGMSNYRTTTNTNILAWAAGDPIHELTGTGYVVWSLSSGGLAVGSTGFGSGKRPVYWDASGAPQQLPISSGMDLGYAAVATDSGVIGGYMQRPGSATRYAAVWTYDGSSWQLDSLGPGELTAGSEKGVLGGTLGGRPSLWVRGRGAVPLDDAGTGNVTVVTPARGAFVRPSTAVSYLNYYPLAAPRIELPDTMHRTQGSVTFTPAFTSAGAGPFVVRVAWGDGTVSADTVGYADELGAFTRDYTGSQARRVIVRVSDAAGRTGADTIVVPANAAPAVSAIGPWTADEGALVTFKATATDANDDALTYSWDLGDGRTASGDSVQRRYADDGVYVVTLTVRDGRGGVTVVTDTATISNLPPTGRLVAPNVVGPGVTFGLAAANVTDPGLADRNQFTYMFNCGDGAGNIDTGTTAMFTCTARATPGTMQVAMLIIDKDGGVREITRTVTVR